MLGDFITRLLIMLFGYAYPAFECYKVVEKNRVEIDELRFWCKYWILVAMLSVTERIGDIFISWFPMYGEMKVAFYVYLWYPKTKGSSYIYETLLRPYIAKHETDIDRKLVEWKAKVWDVVSFYMQNSAEFGQSAFFQFLQYLASQSARFQNNNNGSEVDSLVISFTAIFYFYNKSHIRYVISWWCTLKLKHLCPK
ncbi:HVA22-like protein j [Ziziphus jujuba]|uniref:HVA22-like protein n=4 Tax=Ziziphus jujuba TaxID=326968 RepID=A0A6P6FLT3_ZIZJJ|nr:HVA22-like protein j [Ziziphus jujuba]XP_024922490.3 HVA22-like protein j [Ziziphus jujuba]XP_024922492.3 HVA22-like protein j [Ziziphus jujuba]